LNPYLCAPSPLARAMAYNNLWQMGCCIACGGPLEATRAVLRKDKVGTRSVNYFEGQATTNKQEWGIAEDAPLRLVSVPETLHTVHETNSLDVVNEFYTGKLRTLWLNNHTPSIAFANTAAVAALAPGNNVPIPGNCLVIRSPNRRGGNEYRAVFWRSPIAIVGFAPLRACIRACIQRSGVLRVPGDPLPSPRVRPNPGALFQGCRACNQIMTQESTMRHLLARDVASGVPLVPLNSIFRWNLNKNPALPPLGARTVGLRQQDPNLQNRDNIYFSYQATIAYYIHRCLMVNPGGNAQQRVIRRRYREFDVLFAYILLEVCALLYERTFGRLGGTALRNKPAYRYRGLAELYVSYILWLLLVNDVPEGMVGPGAARIVDISFPVFHRYWFCEMLETLALTHPAAAGATEMCDLIFGNQLFAVGGVLGILPPHRMVAPELVIGHMATSITTFYDNILRPCFSRHMAGLDPEVPIAGALPPVLQRIASQHLVRDMLVHKDGVIVLLRRCETCTPRDLDSFLNRVGVHSVLKRWTDVLESAPPRADRLLFEWVDAWTLHEYNNILVFLRQNPAQPKLSPPVAESIYLMCNVLELPTEPTNQEELNVLRAAPKCSPHKAALRLELAGAFKDEEE
jgi:hypothetical protein